MDALLTLMTMEDKSTAPGLEGKSFVDLPLQDPKGVKKEAT
jgi:hypothetical protein